MSDLINRVCPEFPVERYAVELLANIGSPVLSSRLELLGDNLNHVIEYYEVSRSADSKLLFILDVLSSTVTITISVLRYKYVNRNFAIHNIVTILRFIADNYSFDVPRQTVPRGTKKTTKKVGASK